MQHSGHGLFLVSDMILFTAVHTYKMIQTK